VVVEPLGSDVMDISHYQREHQFTGVHGSVAR
jgi:hypothetical protein